MNDPRSVERSRSDRRDHLAARATLAVLALGLLALPSPAGASSPQPTVDPAPAQAGAAWLVSQLRGGVIPNGSGVNGGFTVDTGLALAAVGGHDADLRRISDAFSKVVLDYVTGDSGGDVGSTYAGATAKSIVLAQVAGADPRKYGGQDLVARLEARVATAGPGAGRISDKSLYPDVANTIGQAFAARGLSAAGSPDAASVTAYLLEQQCAAGFFTLDLSQLGRSCDADPTASPDTDTTSYAILSLESLTGRPGVDRALRRAVAWLAGRQLASGAFDDAPSYGVNANSTGLAAWALGTSGATGVAARASVWLRAHQLVDAGRCGGFARRDEGALAYDDATLTAAGHHAIDGDTRSEFQLATAQALPGLLWTPSGTVSPVVRQELVRAGGSRAVAVHASPGDVVCFDDGHTRVSHRVPASGVARAVLALPAVTSRRTVRVDDGDQRLATQHLQVLAATRFGLTTSVRGRLLTVHIEGLAPRERAVVRVDGVRRGRVTGNRGGHAHLTLHLATAHRVAVLGAFPDRRGSTVIG